MYCVALITLHRKLACDLLLKKEVVYDKVRKQHLFLGDSLSTLAYEILLDKL